VPLLSRTLSDGQAHLPSVHVPLQHWWFFLHFLLRGLHSSSAAATPPSDASVPPTRAAPINLSALPRESVPLESPTASSSKELAPLSSLVIGYPFPQRRNSSAPPKLANGCTILVWEANVCALAHKGGALTSENSVMAKFAEFTFHALG
jgi:hypothetical protein